MHIIIVTPKLDGREHAGHARAVRDAERAANAKGWRFDYLDVSGCPRLPEVRNLLTAQALAMGADEVVFVDNDIAFTPETFVALIERDCDVVGAAPQARLNRWDEGGRLVWQPLDASGGEVDPDTGLMEVAGLGGGFMKARRRVFGAIAEANLAPLYLIREAPPEAWPYLRRHFAYALQPFDADADPWLAARLKLHGGVPEQQLYYDEGEDYTFCRNARAVGFKVYVDARLEVVHHEGRCVLDLSFKKIDAMREEMERAAQLQGGAK